MTHLAAAHHFASKHKTALLQGSTCGCFYCLEIYVPAAIKDWIPDQEDSTALCPYCCVDAVIGESSGHAVTPNFLREMNAYWFPRG